MNDDVELRDITSRLRRLEVGIGDIPNFQIQPTDHEYRVSPVRDLKAVSTNIAARLTRVVITWLSVEDPTVERYEVWVSRLSSGTQAPHLVASVTDSPAAFNIVSDAAGNGLAIIRTIMRNGLSTPLTASPSVTFQVF